MMSEPRLPAPDARPAMTDLRQIADWETVPGELQHPAPGKLMTKLGLAVFQEPGNHATARLWVGHVDPLLSEHDRWLYTALPYTDSWHRCMRLKWACDASPRELRDPGDGHETLLNTLRMLETLNTDLSQFFFTEDDPRLQVSWLMAQHLALGIMDPFHISRLPLGVNWGEVHQLLHHTDAWRAANNVVGMPLDLLVRMHGLGGLMEHGGLLDLAIG